MTDKLMDTEPGGESTQYESIKTVTNPTDKEQGQLGAGEPSSSSSHRDSVSSERGEKTTENIRYGQAISESGFGGKTTVAEGVANQGGYGGAQAREDEKLKNTRKEQKYGGGNDVGA